MNVTSKINVDLTRANIGARVNAVQGDGNTRSVEITLLSDGRPWTPPEGADVAIAYYQPGGTKGLYNLLADGTQAITISGNVATIILAPQMLAVSGTVQASLVFNDAELNRLTTFPFSVSVASNPAAGAQKTEDYLRLQWLEDKLEEYLAALKESGVFDGKPGDNGVTFTPSVSENGDLSWSNDGGLPNPPTVNIKGPKPVDGVDYGTPEEIAVIAQQAAEILQPDLSQIKDDLSKLDMLDLQLVRDTLGVDKIYDGEIVYDCPGGVWKYKSVTVSENVTGIVSIQIDRMLLPEGGHIRIYNADKTKQFTPNVTDSGIRVVDLTGYTGLTLQLQASESTACEAGTYYAKGIRVYSGDITKRAQGLPDYFVGTDEIKERVNRIEEASAISIHGKNLFDHAVEVFEGKFINYNTTYGFAFLGTNTAYTTYFVPTEKHKYVLTKVSDGKPYNLLRFAMPFKNYDGTKNRFNGHTEPAQNTSTIDNTECGSKYYAVTFQTATYSISDYRLSEPGFNTETHYGSGHWMFESITENPNLHCYLPTEICVAVGRTIELYNSLVCLEANKYHLDWTCDVGTDYARKWSVTGTTATVGDHTLTLRIYDDNLTVIKTFVTTVKIVEDSISEQKKILPIGDSLTNGKAWLGEIGTLSNGLIGYVGTRGTTIHHEGRSGATAKWYNDDSSYTFDSNYSGSPSVSASSNPFWNGTGFSLQHYLTTQSGYVDVPDAVQLLLGTNGIALDPAENVANIKVIVDSIHSEYPDIPIFVCNTIYRSTQDGYYSTGSDGYAVGQSDFQYRADMKIMNLQNALADALAEYANVHIVPLGVCMDRDYNFGQKEVAVNPRSALTVKIPNESVHPQNEGYMQMADVMYSSYVAHMR